MHMIAEHQKSQTPPPGLVGTLTDTQRQANRIRCDSALDYRMGLPLSSDSRALC